MKRSSTPQFKSALDKAFGSLGTKGGEIGVLMNAATLKGNLKEKENLKGGLADGKSLMDIAQMHAYDDSTDSTTKERIQKMYDYLKIQLDKGIRVEMEHTKNKLKAKEIAMDHLFEDPKYYQKLKKIEGKESSQAPAKREFAKDLQNDPDFKEFKKRSKYKDNYKEFSFGVPNVTVDDPYISKRKYSRPGKEETKETTGTGGSSGSYVAPFAMDSKFMEKSNKETPKKVEANEVTGASSAGQYSSPAMWAKSTNKKDWRGANKPVYSGGKFVKVKGKCKKFPYCNQGDIKSLKIWENEKLAESIIKISKKTGLSESTIKSILQYEISNIKSKKK
jgi:hypothetical protein